MARKTNKGITEVNGVLYFSGNDGATGGSELWHTGGSYTYRLHHSDGTTAGTTALKGSELSL